MKDDKKDEEESSLQYDDASNLYGWLMSQPLTADGFK